MINTSNPIRWTAITHVQRILPKFWGMPILSQANQLWKASHVN